MKKLCEKLAEQYAEDKSKAYYIDQNGDQKWYMTERGRYSKEDFLAGYQAAKPQWIGVKDRLPEENEEVLVFGNILNAPKLLGVRYRVLGDQDWKYSWQGDGYIFKQDYVTHWMPLPAPPKEEK